MMSKPWWQSKTIVEGFSDVDVDRSKMEPILLEIQRALASANLDHEGR